MRFVVHWSRLHPWAQAVLLFFFHVEYVRVQQDCTSFVLMKFPRKGA